MTDSVIVPTRGTDSEIKQYLTFLLNEQEYGIELLKIQEIRGYTDITPLPNVPPYVKGLLNLRGTVLPVLDLRSRFGMPENPYNKFTVIVVANLGSRIVGLIVDSVSDVLSVPTADIQATPDFGHDPETNLVSGMLRTGDKLAVLLDLDKILSVDADVSAVVPCS